MDAEANDSFGGCQLVEIKASLRMRDVWMRDWQIDAVAHLKHTLTFLSSERTRPKSGHNSWRVQGWDDRRQGCDSGRRRLCPAPQMGG